MNWYPALLFALFYAALVALVVLFSDELKTVRSEGVAEDEYRSFVVIDRARQYARALVRWVVSVGHVALFKGAAAVHSATSHITTRAYRRASKSREDAQVSTLLRSLKETQ